MPSRRASRLHQRLSQLVPLRLTRSGERFAAWQRSVEFFSSGPPVAAWRAALARAEGALSLFSVQKEADSVQERPRQALEEAPASKRAVAAAQLRERLDRSREVLEEMTAQLDCEQARWLRVVESAVEFAQFHATSHLHGPVSQQAQLASHCERFLFWVRLRQPSG